MKRQSRSVLVPYEGLEVPVRLGNAAGAGQCWSPMRGWKSLKREPEAVKKTCVKAGGRLVD